MENDSIRNLKLPNRISNALIRGGVYYIEQILNLPILQLSNIKHVGKRSTTEIVVAMQQYGYTDFGFENNMNYGVYPWQKIYDSSDENSYIKERAKDILNKRLKLDEYQKNYLKEKERLYNDFLLEHNLNNYVYHKDRPNTKAKIFPKKLFDEKINQEEIFICYQTADNIGYYPKYVELTVNINAIDIYDVMSTILETYYPYIEERGNEL